MGRNVSRYPIGMQGGMYAYSFVGNTPIKRAAPLGLFGMDLPGAAQRASLGSWMMQNGESPEEISKTMAPPPPVSVATFECKAGLTAALGLGLSGSVAVNSRSGMGATASYQTSTIAARASASCGLKIADPNAKPLPVALGGAVGLGLLNIEATQTSTYPDIYIGIGPGVGPEIKAPLNPSLNVAY